MEEFDRDDLDEGEGAKFLLRWSWLGGRKKEEGKLSSAEDESEKELKSDLLLFREKVLR